VGTARQCPRGAGEGGGARVVLGVGIAEWGRLLTECGTEVSNRREAQKGRASGVMGKIKKARYGGNVGGLEKEDSEKRRKLTKQRGGEGKEIREGRKSVRNSRIWAS